MKLLIALFWAVLIGPIVLLVAGQMGLLKGTMPTDLGVKDGKLKPPARTPNSVSSQASLHEGDGAGYAQIDPLRYAGLPADALTRIGAIVLKMPGARIMQSGPDYLYVQFTTRWLKFVDDTEFAVIDGVIHVRSASRIGRKDFGVNRARIEAIRAQLNAPQLGTSAQP
jgi:uncharacterized protein (DUF1499 family)